MIDPRSYDYSKLMGRTAKFIPTACNERSKGQVVEYARPVKGRVTYINKAHGWFLVEYEIGGCTQCEGWKLADIGKDVTLLGRC